MRYFVAALCVAAFSGIGVNMVYAQQTLHPISDAEVRAMAYAGCTEARGEPLLGEYLVQYVVYMRGIEDKPGWGGWNLVRVTHKPYQFDGVAVGRCTPAAWRRSIRIAGDIADGLFVPGGWASVRYFKNPCEAAPGSFAGLVYVGTIGQHEFYRSRRPGERPRHGPGCRRRLRPEYIAAQ